MTERAGPTRPRTQRPALEQAATPWLLIAGRPWALLSHLKGHGCPFLASKEGKGGRGTGCGPRGLVWLRELLGPGPMFPINLSCAWPQSPCVHGAYPQ